MPSPPIQHTISADAHRVPPPFRAFAVRSEEARHAALARAPYGRLHRLQLTGLDAAALAGLATAGRARVRVEAFSDIEHARTTPKELVAAAPGLRDLPERLASALQLTGVLGDEPARYRRSIDTRIDCLVCCGAGFHNDVGRHWSRCLFWVLALQADDVEFVMPHASVRQPLAPGDLLVFDPSMAHGLCRPSDAGQAVAASFDGGAQRHQVFLTGELLLSDAQWAALGSPWLPVEEHERRGAIDLMVASFDERTGLIQRLRALGGAMQRSA